MTQNSKLFLAISLMLALIAAPTFGANVALNTAGGQLSWNPDFEVGQAELRVHGPDGIEYHRTFQDGEALTFSLSDLSGEITAGSYTWSLTAVSKLSPEMRDRFDAARASRDIQGIAQLKAEAGFQALTIDGHFYFDGLQMIVHDRSAEEASRLDMPTKDQVFFDDVIVNGSICAGLDCVNGESFGFDTLRLKENNLRIRAQDTSNTASFPSRDWQITFNDSGNGGANKFSIDDIDGARTPFTIEAGAPSNSIFLEDSGQVGFGTATPVADLHVVSGNTPTLRLEQDGTSGFTPLTWDLAGNEANLFIRDATNGSDLPFRVYPNAGTNALVIEGQTGDIGIGTNSPTADLHVLNSGSGATDGQLLVENNNGTVTQRVLLRVLNNNGDASVQIENAQAGANTARWNASARTTGFEISRGGTGHTEMLIDPDGDTTLRGTLTVCGTGLPSGSCGVQTTYPDYVFDEGYDLMPLGELKTFIADNGHLPKVPTVEEVSQTGIDMTALQLRLLEKVEELTLYTLAQQDLLEEQAAVIEELKKQMAQQ